MVTRATWTLFTRTWRFTHVRQPNGPQYLLNFSFLKILMFYQVFGVNLSFNRCGMFVAGGAWITSIRYCGSINTVDIDTCRSIGTCSSIMKQLLTRKPAVLSSAAVSLCRVQSNFQEYDHVCNKHPTSQDPKSSVAISWNQLISNAPNELECPISGKILNLQRKLKPRNNLGNHCLFHAKRSVLELRTFLRTDHWFTVHSHNL